MPTMPGVPAALRVMAGGCPVTALLPDGAHTRRDDVVVLVVPADNGYLSVLRTATAGLAARLKFSLEEIEDLRIAVDEACAMLIGLAGTQIELTSEFELTGDAVAVSVSVPVDRPVTLPTEGSFSWQVLSALAGEVTAAQEDDRIVIRLTKRRAVS
jgi:serine/threonine-protein kinase RsbW